MMKKHLLTTRAAAALMAAMAAPVLAQNLAVVNGKAIPKTRMDVLAQQVARSGRPVTPEMQGQLRDEVIAREIFIQAAQAKGLSRAEKRWRMDA